MRKNGRKGFTIALIVALLLVVIPAWAVSRPVTTRDILLSSGTVELTVGDKATVQATVVPEDSTQPVKWSSSDRKVATVVDGVVTAKGKGTATITASSGDREATLEVKAVPKPVRTTAITLSPSGTVKLTIGETTTIEATVVPWNSTQSVKWSSSDKTVATVRKGVVKAKGKGTAIITAKSGSKKARVKVKVVPKTVKTTKLTLSPSKTIKLTVGDRKTVKANVEPKDSTQGVKWSSSDKKVARVNSKGIVTARGKGTATITARSGSKKASVKVKVRVSIQPEPTAKPAVTDMPEPANTDVPEPTVTEEPTPTAMLAPEPTATEQPVTDRTLVAYFSCTGTTEGVARKLANVTGADLYRIVPAEPYTAEDLDYGNRNNRATYEQDHPDIRPEIGGKPLSLKGYTTLYLGYPIWWGMEPRILCTFVELYDFTGITVIPFCTSGSSGIGTSGSDLAKLAGTGRWLDGARHSGSISESALRDWVESMKY